MHIYKHSTIFLIIVFLFAGRASGEKPNPLTFRAGLGYDFVSQEYFLDSIKFSGGDSVLELSLLEKEYLDDKKALFFFRYQSGLQGHYILEGGWEQTSELFRTNGRGFLTLGDYQNQLQIEFNFDVKERYRGIVVEGEEMTTMNGVIRLKNQLLDNLNGRIRLSGESVIFDTLGSYLYNYSRLSGDIELDLITNNYNSIYSKFGLEKRYVTDSIQLNYNLMRGSLGYLGSLFGGPAAAEISIESKTYNQLSNPDDYFLITFNTNLRMPLAEKFNLITKFELENYNFNDENYINEDYYQIRSGFHLGYESGDFTLSVGPEFEFLAINSEFENDDDFFEILVFTGVDLYQEGIFLFLDNQIGHRSYKNDPPFYSDFTFDRLSLIGSATIFEGLNIELLFSAEWEWHRIGSDDSRLYLLSSSLTYTF